MMYAKWYKRDCLPIFIESLRLINEHHPIFTIYIHDSKIYYTVDTNWYYKLGMTQDSVVMKQNAVVKKYSTTEDLENIKNEIKYFFNPS